MKKLVHFEEFNEFKTRYEKVSGLTLPLEYLQRSCVFAFFKGHQMVGGFVLSDKSPLRTIDVFIAPDQRQRIAEHIGVDQCVEVCCFWIDRKYRRNLLFNTYFWLKLAYTVNALNHKFVLFGTNSKGLAKMYGYPKNALLYHQDNINNIDTFVFIALKKKFAGGIWEIILAKLLRRQRNRDIDSKETLEKSLMYELSK